MHEQKIKNMEQFAAVSGISRPTVSKYFNDPSSVRTSTRQKIEAALEQYDYRPNIYAINQNRRLTKNIGVIVPHIGDPFFAEMARNIETLIIAAGFRPMTLSAHGDANQEVENLENLRSLRPAGVLMAPLGRSSHQEAIQALCDEVPTILFDSHIVGMGAAFVGSNNNQSIGLIVNYLCETGEPPVFFEMREPSNPNANKRRLAYLAAMEQLGHRPHIIQAEGQGWDFEEIGYREGKRVILQKLLRTNTILCSNDRLAIGFLAAAFEMNLRVGGDDGYDIRVAGHDDHPFSRYTCPNLTTVSQDYSAIAETSAASLLQLIDQEDHSPEDRVTLFDGALVIRGSA
ncbi:MAG: LacI family DNA-binding transcriptional regulator [Pseudomonadota bacterium]